MEIVLQALCAFLLSIGILFVFIELRSRFERSFLYFGISTVLLCLFAAIDIWVFPRLTGDKLQYLYWLRIQHVLACAIFPFLVTYLLMITESISFKKLSLTILPGFIMAVLFLSDLMLTLKNDKITAGYLYNFLFCPLYIVFFGYILFEIVTKLSSVSRSERKILFYHILGMGALLLFGIIDIFTIVMHKIQSFPFTLAGILCFVGLTSFAFTERLTGLINERKKVLDELKSAYKDLESANTLKQIGQSTAIINHEIKNYMFIISGDAQLLKRMENLSTRGNKMVQDIIDTATHLVKFSKDILDLSKAEIIKDKDKSKIVLNDVITTCIDKYFKERKDKILFDGFTKDYCIYGDWIKLDHVFMNIVNNAFEAESSKIKMSLFEKSAILCLTIEDDGVGCSPEELKEIFTAFYTSKKKSGGTGLGLSIARAIIESHGGQISAYTKNTIQKRGSGLVFNITFPIFSHSMNTSYTDKHNVILLKDGMDSLKELLHIFKNVNFNPFMIQDITGLSQFKNQKDIPILLANAEMADVVKKKYSNFCHICILRQFDGSIYIIDRFAGRPPEIFSEEFILKNLM